MDTNVFSKDEIMRELAQRGNFIDSYTLDSFFQKWRIEAIFENERGEEFFDKNVLELVSQNLFNNTQDNDTDYISTTAKKEIELSNSAEFNNLDDASQSQIPLLEENSDEEASMNSPKETKKEQQNPTTAPTEAVLHKMGILEGALDTLGQKLNNEEKPKQTKASNNNQEDESDDFDDISLLSESFEAQEKFREYVLSQMKKKNMGIIPANENEFKLDIPEKTINMIAKSLANKIVKHITALCSKDAIVSEQVTTIKEQNAKLERKIKDLEEQNKKLRLLLTESNKNLNSYKPSIFGLYKKVTPKTNK